MINFRRVFKALGPGWLTSGDGEKVLYSVGVMLDATLERARQALVSRFPEYAETEDALGYLGRDRLIIRGRNESAASYAKRLVEWRYPLGHRVRGNAYAMLRQIRAYFLDRTTQFTIDRRGTWHTIDADGNETRQTESGTWNWDAEPSSSWARFWLGVYGAPIGWSAESEYVIGDAELWGGVISDTSEYAIGFGETVTQSELQAVRAIARDWKMAGSSAESLLVVLDDSLSASDVVAASSTDWSDWDGGSAIALGIIPVKLT